MKQVKGPLIGGLEDPLWQLLGAMQTIQGPHEALKLRANEAG